MTGPEHYRAAESLMGYLEKGTAKDSRVLEVWLAQAQVHATLALAAATAAAIRYELGDRRSWAWKEASGGADVAPE